MKNEKYLYLRVHPRGGITVYNAREPRNFEFDVHRSPFPISYYSSKKKKNEKYLEDGNIFAYKDGNISWSI